MQDYNSKQLEMFSNKDFNQAEQDERIQNNIWVKKEINKRKLIIAIIIFILINLLSFSLGVEKGARIKMQKQSIQNNPQVQPAPIQEEIKIPINSEKGTKTDITKKEEKIANNGYSIQVASYRSNEKAKKEVDSLKNKGYNNVFSIKKGNYFIVCIGSFQDKKDASVLLKELKKIYKDPLIRRI